MSSVYSNFYGIYAVDGNTGTSINSGDKCASTDASGINVWN